jgi:signal transduction histidine kinase
MDLPITAVTAVSNVLLGLFTYYKNPKSATNILFTFLSFTVVGWTITNYFSLHASSLEMTLFWIRLVLFIVTPMWTALFLLAWVFPGDKLSINKTFLFGLLAYTIVTSLVAISPYMFTGITGDLNNPQPVPGPGIVLHALLAIGSLVASTLLLIRKFGKADARAKTQLRFFLGGVVTSFSLLIFTNFIMVNVFKNTSLVVIGPFFTLLLVGSISYAIVKHRFLDIRAVVAKAVVYALFLVTLGGFYSLAFFLVGSALLSIPFSVPQMIFYGALAFVVAFSFQALKRAIEKITDSIFFKGYYQPQELLKILSTIMSTTIILDSLTTQILDKLLSEMRITKGVFVTLAKNEQAIEFVEFKGFSQKPVFSIGDINEFLIRENILIFEELEESQLKAIMRSLNISVVLPLRVQQAKIGVLILGEKASGEIYSQEDIGVLDILAPQLSVAIQNSKEYEEIKRFNITLREEVDRATKDLQVANVKLTQLDKLKDDFVSIASHELRTPMTAIRSYVWMALNRPDITLSEKMKKYLGRTLQSTERLINLVNDMLNVSRIEAGRIEINPQSFNIVNLSKEIMEEVKPKADEKAIKLFVMESQMPAAFGDPDKIHEVLLNLVGNALKFTPNEGTITIGFFSDGHTIETSVKDSGVGISKEDLARLFRKFERLDSSYVAVSSSAGTGLGLYISKSLVTLMNGKIWANSEGLGKGTTFTFSLPLATADLLAQSEKFHIKPADGEAKGLEPASI